jgi:hypothetical protein
MSSTEEPEPATAEDREFFRAIEETFLQLRGRTTLLGPEDFRVAQEWRHSGVPVDLVRHVMSDLFTRQQLRKSRRGISSLRYFRAAVEAAWRERLELGAGGVAPLDDPGPPIVVRLARLAAALPEDLPGRARCAARIQSLLGDFEEVEVALARLESELLGELDRRLPDAAREELTRRVGRSLDRLGAELPPAERQEVAGRLLVQAIRNRFRVPLLSLFGPIAVEVGEEE